MADGKGKMVFMRDPAGKEYDVPAENVEKAKTEYGWTEATTSTPPPVTQPQGKGGGFIRDVVPAFFDTPRRMYEGMVDLGRGLWSGSKEDSGGLGSFTRGVIKEAVGSIPSQVMTIAGAGDPSQVKVPGSVMKGLEDIPTFDPELGLSQEQIKQFRTAPTPAQEQETLQSIGIAPQDAYGRAGGLVGTGLQFALTRRLGGTKAAQLAEGMASNSFLKSSPFFTNFLAPGLQAAAAGGPKAKLLADFVISAAQSYSKGASGNQALQDAFWSSLIDAGFGGSAVPLRKGLNSLKTFFAQKALPVIESADESVKQSLKYFDELTDRLVKTKSTFTKEGLEANDVRFKKTVAALKGASGQADELLDELHNLNLVPEDALQLVDYRTPVDAAFLDMLQSATDVAQRQRLLRLKKDVQNVLPQELRLDSQGNSIPVLAKDAFGRHIPVPELDARGNPIPTGRSKLVYKTDMDGNPVVELVRDSKGRPIPVGQDANGNLVFQKKRGPQGELIFEPQVDAQGRPVYEPIYKQATDASGRPIYQQAVDMFDEPMFEGTGRVRNLTFTEAEAWKAKFNNALHRYYSKKLLDPSNELDKQIKDIFADSIRKAQSNAFDLLAQTTNQLRSLIPAGSKAADMKPWDLYVPGINTPLKYSDAARVARMDADISQSGWIAQRQSTAQADSSIFNPMAAAIAATQAAYGSFITPSQFATAYRAGTARSIAPSVSKFLGQAATPNLFTRNIPLAFSKGYLAFQKPEPSVETPSAESLLSESESRFQILPTPNAAAPAAKEAPKAAVPAAKEKSKKSADYFKSKI